VQLRKPFSKRPIGGKADIWASIDGLASRTGVDRVADGTSVPGLAVRTSVDRVASRTSVAVIVREPSARDLHRGSPADGR
jgi:hypothetical protein